MELIPVAISRGAQAPHLFFRAILVLIIYIFILLASFLGLVEAHLKIISLLCFLQIFLSGIYVAFGRTERGATFSAYTALTLDSLFITALVHYLGMLEYSPFLLLYALIILYGGLVLQTKGGVWVSLVSVLGYLWVWYNSFSPEQGFERSDLTELFTMSSLMLLVGYAAGVLGAKLHEKSLALSKALTELDLYSKNLEHKNSELEDQKAQIQEMYSTISSQLNQLTQKNQELNESHLELKEAQAQLQDYAKNLEEKVAEQTRKLEEQMNLLVQMEKMAAMGNLVATVSHNVGNKVGAASTFVSFVVEGVESLEKQLFEKFDPTESRGILKQVKEDLATYKESLDKVVEMVKNMKEFVRMGHEGEEVDLCRSINVTAKILDYDFIGDRVQLKRDFEPEVPPTRGMMGLINDVFMNLFLNSRDAIHKRREQLGVKYSMEFPGEIDVKVRRNGTHVEVVVKDNGSGMPMEYIEKIKKGFFTSKPLGTGTGLGVRFCREVVEKYGGRVEIESQIDVGTTFILWFPIHPNHLHSDAKG